MVVKTVVKSSPERLPLRRLSSLERKGARKSSGGKIVKEIKGLDEEKAVAPHYQRPTANSSNQARVQSKSFTQTPSQFTKVRRFSLGLESPDACKYVRKSSLLGSKTSEKGPMKINRLKSSKSLEKTPVKINALKPSRAFDKTPGLLKLKTPKSDLCCKTLNVARDTCSSNCKHVVKGGDLTISPEPRCPYHYCSLNHLDRVEPPSVKQFLASRRRLLRTQKSFKWVGLTPVPKGSGVGRDSLADIGHGVNTDIVIDSGHDVDTDSVVDTGQGLCVVGHGDTTREEDAVEVGNKSDDDRRPEDCQIVDCDDYDDDGLLFESGDSHRNDGILIDEISMDESEVKVEVDESMELFAGDEDVEIDNQEIDLEAIDHDMASNSYDYDQLAESLVDVSAVKVRADESMEVFAEDKDDKDDDCDLDVEAFVYIQIAESLVDNNDVKVRAEESVELFAGYEDVEIDKHEIDIEAIDHDMASNSYDYDQLAESLVDASDVKVRDDESMEVFAEDKDGKDDDCDLDVEAFLYNQIAESLVDNNDAKVRAEDSVELFAGDEDVEIDKQEIDIEAIDHDMASNSYDYDQLAESLVDVSDVKVRDDESMEVFAKDKDGKDDDCDLDVEAFVYDQIAESLVDNNDVKVRAEEPVELFAEDTDIKDDNHGVDVEASSNNMANNCHDYGQTEERLRFIQVHELESEFCSQIEPDGLLDVSLSEVNSCLQDKVKEEDNCNLLSFEGGPVSEVCTNDPIEQFVECEDDSDRSEETELQCYIPVNPGIECGSPTEPDCTPGVLFSLENKYVEDVVEEEYDCSSGSLEGLFVSGVCVNDHIELSDGCKDDYDQIEDPEPRCFIQVNVFGPECNSSTEPDGLSAASLLEANSSLKGEVKEQDECISGSSKCGSISDDSDQSEETELQCYIPVNHGTKCSSPMEPDRTPCVSFSLANKYLEDVVEEEYDCSSGSLDGLFVSEVCANDHIELSVGCNDDYDRIEDPEPRCFIQVNVFGSECNSSTEPDGLPDASWSEANSSLKGEVKEEDGCISGSSECGSVSGVSAYDLIEQSASCQDDYDQSEDTEQQCFILINALGTDCSSQRDYNGLPNVSFSEVNSCPIDEAKEEHDYVSESTGVETASNVNTNGHTEQFVGWEDDQGANGRLGNKITELDSNKYGEVDSSCSGDGNLNCHIQVGTFGVQCSSNTEVDSPQKIQVIESIAGPKQVIKEECIHIALGIFDGFDDDCNLTSLFAESRDEPTAGPKQVIKEECIDVAGSILDGLDNDYNLTSLFAECKDDSSRESESKIPIQFNIYTDADSPIDKSLFEFNINSKFDEDEDVHTLACGEDGFAFETHGDDFEEQYLESENTTNEITRTSNDFDDDYTMDPEPSSEMREEFCDISGHSMIGSVTECESLKSGPKGYKIISEENNKPYRLKFRQGHVHPFDNQKSEAEKVDLRHQMTEERRAAHEWMLDYALTNIVKKLSPFRQRKVELLVEAFETVTPLSKCETNDLPHATRAFTCSRPIQACN